MTPIAELITDQELAQLRRDGATFAQIARSLGVCYSTLRRHAHQVLPNDLIHPKHKPHRITSQLYHRYQRLDDGTRSPNELATLLGCQTLTVFHLKKKRAKLAQAGRCIQCRLTGDDRNPITPTGRCLWCELDLRQVNLAHFYRTVDPNLIPQITAGMTLPPPDIETEASQCQHP